MLGLLLENLFPISLEQKYPELAYILKQDSDYRIPRLPDGSLLAEDVDRYEKAEEEKMKQFIKEVKCCGIASKHISGEFQQLKANSAKKQVYCILLHLRAVSAQFFKCAVHLHNNQNK